MLSLSLKNLSLACHYAEGQSRKRESPPRYLSPRKRKEKPAPRRLLNPVIRLSRWKRSVGVPSATCQRRQPSSATRESPWRQQVVSSWKPLGLIHRGNYGQ